MSTQMEPMTAAEFRAALAEGKFGARGKARARPSTPARPQPEAGGLPFQPALSPELGRPEPEPIRKKTTSKPKSRRVPEREVQAAIVSTLRSKGWLVVRVNAGSVKRGEAWVRSYIIHGFVQWVNQMRQLGVDKRPEKAKESHGFPDLLALRGDRFLAIEVKAKGGRSEVSQERFRRYAAGFGVAVHTFDSWLAAHDFVHSIPSDRRTS